MSNYTQTPHDKNAVIIWTQPEDWETRTGALLIQNEGSTVSIQQDDEYIEIHKETIPELIKALKNLSKL